jgi:hypothetical protein
MSVRYFYRPSSVAVTLPVGYVYTRGALNLLWECLNVTEPSQITSD